jgi:hypothetical protein
MKTKINIFIFRLFYIAIVCVYSFAVGIGVAMGFDAGVSLLPSLVALAYFFTVIPAILLGLLPLNKILSPPLILKIWYFWIILLLCIYTVFSVKSNHKSKMLSQKIGPSGELCVYQRSNNVNDKVWVEMAFPKIDFEKRPRVPMEHKGRRCRNYATRTEYAVLIRAYDANISTNAMSPTIEAKLYPNKKTCVGIYPSALEKSLWEVKNEECNR